MATNIEKRNEKTRQIMAVMKGGSEPVLSIEDYKMDLVKAMVWYNNNEDDRTKRKWLETFLTKTNQKPLIATFNKVPDYEIRQVAVICRMQTLERYLEQKDIDWANAKIKELTAQFSKVKVKVKDAPAVPVVSIQTRMQDAAHLHAAEIDGAIDDFILNKTVFSAKAYLKGQQVAAPVTKRIGAMYVNTLAELREAIAGDDKQLVEGYSHLTKRELKKFADFVGQIVEDCQQQVVSAKVNQKPRTRKPVPVGKQVSKMKFLQSFPELNLKSVPLTQIIGSTEVWFYNTRLRKFGVYKGEAGNNLSVKGTTILGFDIKESKQLTLRKPEEFFTGLALGKRALGNALKTLTTKSAIPNGRFNEDTILIGAF